jgi:hypothetical protein
MAPKPIVLIGIILICLIGNAFSKPQKLLTPVTEKMVNNDSIGKILGLARYNEAKEARESDKPNFTLIDEHAHKSTNPAKRDVKSLAAYLFKPTRSDWQKVRAIYTWIINNVDYEFQVYRGLEVSEDPMEVLKSGKAICTGFAYLFQALAEEAGLEAYTVTGYSKSRRFLDDKDAYQPNHIWNAVRIKRKWHLFDTTWGSGEMTNGLYLKHPNYFWFDTPPEDFLFTHFPVDPEWQLVPEPYTLSEFKRFPKLEDSYFRLGFSGKDALACLTTGFDFKFPEVYEQIGSQVQLIKGPVPGRLAKAKPYYFLLQASGIQEIMVENGAIRQVVTPDNGYFATIIKPETGELIIYLLKPQSDRYQGIVKYTVE